MSFSDLKSPPIYAPFSPTQTGVSVSIPFKITAYDKFMQDTYAVRLHYYHEKDIEKWRKKSEAEQQKETAYYFRVMNLTGRYQKGGGDKKTPLKLQVSFYSLDKNERRLLLSKQVDSPKQHGISADSFSTVDLLTIKLKPGLYIAEIKTIQGYQELASIRMDATVGGAYRPK